MKKVFFNGCMVVLLLFCITMTGCASQDSILGTWYLVDGEETITFYEDGTCIASGDETAEYKQQEDGTLIITWGVFGNERIVKRTDDIDQALEEYDEYYYLSGNTLALNGEKCEKKQSWNTYFWRDGLIQKHIWAYYLTDIDNDRKVDLLVKAGSCEADVKLYFYQYKNARQWKVSLPKLIKHQCYFRA